MEPGASALRRSIEIAGRTLTLETGRLAMQASGAVLVSYGDTVVLVSATCSNAPREGIDFFPLTVDYEERLYAVGRIPGGFIKREGRPTEKATLSARLIDRPIRPLFPKGYRNDVHVVTTVLSVDQDSPPDIMAIIGASAALTLSEIPFSGPIAAVSMGLVDGRPVTNPNLDARNNSAMQLVIAGTADAVMMVEAGAQEVSESDILEAISTGHDEIRRLVEFINEFREEALKIGLAREKHKVTVDEPPKEIVDAAASLANKRLEATIRQGISEGWKKAYREENLRSVREEITKQLLEENPDWLNMVSNVYRVISDIIGKEEKKIVRRLVTQESIRVDGRALDQVRPISCEVGLLPRTHGSGLFTRGETQVLTVATLGAVGDEQILDGLGVEESKRYMHHYNMPPYSVGEARPMRGPGRREIGHGALAERALEPVLPNEEEFPYTIRLVSEVISSNGSTSMGSVCGSTLALMDAGVPIKSVVAGVAMGLVKEEERVAILTDIQGVEDALGDMDFKVAGTKSGITALQMDIKVAGLDRSILASALEQALRGRLFILERIQSALPAPRPELSKFAPRIIRFLISPDKIRDIIGPGGKTIKKIIDETGVKIDIEDDGRVFIAAVDGVSGQNAIKIIEGLTQEVQAGKIYTGRVTRVTDFGAFVEVVPGVLGLPGKEGLVHISQMAHNRVARVQDVVKEGDDILVKAIGFDQQGRLKLSRKDALPPAQQSEQQVNRTKEGLQNR